MGSDINRMSSVTFKILGGLIVASLCVTAGIKIGRSTAISDNETSESHQGEMTPKYVMNFGGGDAIPSEAVVSDHDSTVELNRLLEGKRSLVFIVHFGCPPCLDLLEFCQKNKFKSLNKSVQVVVCLQNDEANQAELYGELLGKARVVTYNREEWGRLFHLGYYPILIGVDESSIVSHIQYGFDGSLDYELLSEFFSSQR